MTPPASRPPIDQQITFVYTHDLDQTAAFYEDTLGLELALDQGGCRIYRVAGTAFIGICQRDDAPTDMQAQGRTIILTLVTDAVDAWYARLSERGVQFETAPQLNPRYNIYHCFLRDPNGYLIEIQQFRDPRWPAAR